jgi:hypothetical protein
MITGCVNTVGCITPVSMTAGCINVELITSGADNDVSRTALLFITPHESHADTLGTANRPRLNAARASTRIFGDLIGLFSCRMGRTQATTPYALLFRKIDSAIKKEERKRKQENHP